MKEYLFNYRFDGAEWGTSVFADNPEQAKEKIKAMALARYEGELAMRVPVPAGTLIARFIQWWRS